MTRTIMNAINDQDIEEEQNMNRNKAFADAHTHNFEEELKMTNISTNLTANTSSDLVAIIPLMLTIGQLAERTAKMGIKEYRIRQWVVSGQLPYIKAGNKYLISVLDFVAFITHASKANKDELEPETAGGTSRGGNGRIRPIK